MPLQIVPAICYSIARCLKINGALANSARRDSILTGIGKSTAPYVARTSSGFAVIANYRKHRANNVKVFCVLTNIPLDYCNAISYDPDMAIEGSLLGSAVESPAASHKIDCTVELKGMRQMNTNETLAQTWGCYVKKNGVTEGWVRFDNFKTEADLGKAIGFFEWLGFEVR